MPNPVHLRVTTRRQAATSGVVAIIVRDGKILLQKRREHIADPGTWVLPGGTVLAHEFPRETLVRMCGEELGITVRPVKELGVLEIDKGPVPVWQVLWKGQEITLHNQHILGVGWFSVEELRTLSPVRHETELRHFLSTHPFFQELSESESMESMATVAQETSTTTLDGSQILVLVKRAQNGDHDAFGALYDHFVTPIYRYVAFRVPDAVAEDLVADIFVKAWEKLGKYSPQEKTPFSSWLFRIARNIVIDNYRSYRETTELDELREDGDRWNNPTLAITQELESTLLRQALGKLPKRYREVLLLSFISDLDHSAIARTLGMREGSVRILKHRALKKLAVLLPASMREELP